MKSKLSEKLITNLLKCLYPTFDNDMNNPLSQQKTRLQARHPVI